MSTVRSASEWLTVFGVMVISFFAVYYIQFGSLPTPLTSEEVGKGGFSEVEAEKHVKYLSELGPHTLGSDTLDDALDYILKEAEKIKAAANWEAFNVEVERFQAEPGANRLTSGKYVGKTLVYSNLTHVLLRISPKYASLAADDDGDEAILVSAHVDTVFSAEGAGDDTSSVAVMLELARGISQTATASKSPIIFFFNAGEEEGLSGAHSFITQHPWSKTIDLAVNLEALGIGGKSGIFQSGPQPWAIENFASAAKYPSGNIVSQDLFSSGVIQSSTDFQVYKEVGGLSGLDFAFTDGGAVYHTKNDKFELLKPGSLQHLGENMLAFLLQTPASPDVSKSMISEEKKASDDDTAIFFDILGKYMVVFKKGSASMIYKAVIAQSVMMLAASISTGGYPAAIAAVLSVISIVLMWLFSISLSLLAVFILLQFSYYTVPYIASPWLVIGLFAAPALLGAFLGQNLGFLLLQKFLLMVSGEKKNLSAVIQAELDAEKWLYKAGLIQWLALLIVGNYLQIGSTFLALLWLVPPALAYIFNEATLTMAQWSSSPILIRLNLYSLYVGMVVPVLLTSGFLIRFPYVLIGNLVRMDSNPGSSPEWMGSVIVAISLAAIICLTFVYVLSYAHLSGAKGSIILATSLLFGLSLFLVISGTIPPFTEDTARTINVVHVVDASEGWDNPSSYVSLYSQTPGELTKEAELIGEGFKCSKDNVIDFVTQKISYGCVTFDGTDNGWNRADIPTLRVVDDSTSTGQRMTTVEIDTKDSIRWAVGINFEEIDDFILKLGNGEEIVPFGNKTSLDGWHTVRFVAGKLDAPRKFELLLYWTNDSTQSVNQLPLLKLRTDIERITPKTQSVLNNLPAITAQFGKSTSPHNLAFLTSLPISYYPYFSQK